MDSATISVSTPVAMARLEEEFRNILLSHTVKTELLSLTDPSSGYMDSEYSSLSQEDMNRNSERNLIPDEAIHDLQSIAQRMIAAGCSRECVQSYASVRKIGVEQEFRKLEIEKLSSKSIQRLEWQVQQAKILRWIQAAKICVRLLFAGERRLSEQIFNGLGTNIADACFMQTIKDSAAQLFNFVEAISGGRKSPEKLFQILDLYEVLSDLLPDIETIFGSNSGEFIRKQAVEILASLSEAAREILSEFEKVVFGEISKARIPGGSVHPLTKYVMKYIHDMVEHKQTLTQLIVSNPSSVDYICSSELDFDFSGQASPLMRHLVWILVILKFNLEGKSRQYKDASLAHFFIMNNVHYIVQKIKGSLELREMIGDDYLNKLTSEYNFAANNYLKTSWKRVLDCLRDDGRHKMGRILFGVSKLVLRQRFKAFNAKFKDVLKNQVTWSVPNTELREELRISISEKLIPVYTSFLERYGSHIESWKHPQNYMRYSVEDLEKAVMGMFEGGQ